MMAYPALIEIFQPRPRMEAMRLSAALATFSGNMRMSPIFIHKTSNCGKSRMREGVIDQNLFRYFAAVAAVPGPVPVCATRAAKYR